MAHELVVKTDFTVRDKASGQRFRFTKGQVVSDQNQVALLETSAFHRNVMRRAIPPEAPRAEKKAAPKVSIEAPADAKK